MCSVATCDHGLFRVPLSVNPSCDPDWRATTVLSWRSCVSCVISLCLVVLAKTFEVSTPPLPSPPTSSGFVVLGVMLAEIVEHRLVLLPPPPAPVEIANKEESSGLRSRRWSTATYRVHTAFVREDSGRVMFNRPGKPKTFACVCLLLIESNYCTAAL